MTRRAASRSTSRCESTAGWERHKRPSPPVEAHDIEGDAAPTLALVWAFTGSLYVLNAAAIAGSGVASAGSVFLAAGSLSVAVALLAHPNRALYAAAGGWALFIVLWNAVLVLSGTPPLVPVAMLTVSTLAFAIAIAASISAGGRQPHTDAKLQGR